MRFFITFFQPDNIRRESVGTTALNVSENLASNRDPSVPTGKKASGDPLPSVAEALLLNAFEERLSEHISHLSCTINSI